MKYPGEYLIPIMNHQIRSGTRKFRVFEGWRDRSPLFEGSLSSGRISVTSMGKHDYNRLFPHHPQFPNYFDLVQKVLHASCIFHMEDMEEFKSQFVSIVVDSEPFRRNARFYYDTNSLMNNYFHLFREFIPGFLKKASHTTSKGVMAELEQLMDRKLKNQFFPEEFVDIYGDDREMFLRQSDLVGRIARLAYPEIDLMMNSLRSTILPDRKTGDTEILNAFDSNSQDNNLEGIVVTNDSNMAERASRRMGSWHVRLKIERIEGLRVNIEHFIEAVCRAAVIYGRVKINDDIVIDGVWRGKKNEEWNQDLLEIRKCPDCGLSRISRILQEVPPDFHGKGYYGD